MEFELEQAILKQLNKSNITYKDIVACSDKGKLLNIIDTINAAFKEFSISLELEKFLLNEFILLSCNNIKLVITPFYLQIIIEH